MKTEKQRRKPDWLKTFNGLNLETLVELVALAYGDYIAEATGRKKVILNFKTNYRYRTILMNWLKIIGQLFKSENIILKTKQEILKICKDYFTVLHNYHRKLGHRGFFINQLISLYAVELYQDWINDNYGSLERYIKFATESISEKEKRLNSENIPEEEINKIKNLAKKSKIDGMLEVSF